MMEFDDWLSDTCCFYVNHVCVGACGGSQSRLLENLKLIWTAKSSGKNSCASNYPAGVWEVVRRHFLLALKIWSIIFRTRFSSSHTPMRRSYQSEGIWKWEWYDVHTTDFVNTFFLVFLCILLVSWVIMILLISWEICLKCVCCFQIMTEYFGASYCISCVFHSE